MGQYGKGEIVQYPLLYTYKSMGFTEDEINSDAAFVILQRMRLMNDAERASIGIDDDWFERENILSLMDAGRFRFDYDTTSKAEPTYHISYDIDGSGYFVRIHNPVNKLLSFKPEKNRAMNDSLKLTSLKNEYINDAWLNWVYGGKEKITEPETLLDLPNMDPMLAPNKDFFKDYGFTEQESPKIMRALRGMHYLVLDSWNKGKGGVNSLMRMFNDIPWLPDLSDDYLNTIERTLQENQVNFLTYQDQKAAGEFETFNASKYEGREEKGMGYEYTGTNILLDTIRKQEGGFYSYAYDPKYTGDRTKKFYVGARGFGGGPVEMAAEGSRIRKDEYELMIGEDGDPTIGTGISINPNTAGGKRNIELLEERGYEIEKLLTGEQEITREDDNYILMVNLEEKLEQVIEVTGIEDLNTNKNAYLAIGLVKLMFNTNKWMGERFLKALNNFIETGDQKYLGNFGSYEKGTNNFFSKFNNNGKLLNNYEPAILNELWNDGADEKAQGMGGYMTMFRDVGDFITAWAQGQYTEFPELVVDKAPQIYKKSKSYLD